MREVVQRLEERTNTFKHKYMPQQKVRKYKYCSW